jgi:tyrosyl-tRNA synthetase
MEIGKVNPRDIKMMLAGETTAMYHGHEAAARAEEHFKAVFQKHELPENIPEFDIPADMLDDEGLDAVKLLVQTGFSASNSEARRLISQGALKINGDKCSSFKIPGLCNGDILQAGKLKFIKLKLNKR